MAPWWSSRFDRAPAGWQPRAERAAGPAGARGAENGARPARPPLRWPLTAALFLALLHLVLYPPQPRFDVSFPKQGEVADREIRAPFAFRAPLLQRELETLQLEKVLSEPPVLRRQTPAPGQGPLERFATWRRACLVQLARADAPLDEEVGVLSTGGVVVPRGEVRRLLTSPRPEALLDALQQSLADLYEGGVADMLPPGKYTQAHVLAGASDSLVDATRVTPQASLPERLQLLLRAHGVDAETAAWAPPLALPFVIPNLSYDPVETRVRQDEARRSVPTQREYIKGERIVDHGVRVGEQEALHLRVLHDLLAERGSRPGGGSLALSVATRLLLLLAALGLYGLGAWLYFPEVLRRLRFLIAVSATVAVFLAVSALILGRSDLGPFAVPVPLLATLITVLFRDRAGLATTLLGILLLSLLPDTDGTSVFVWLLLGLATVAAVRRIRRRGQFYRAIAMICALSLVLITVLRLAAGISLGALGLEYVVGLLVPIVSVALALFLLPVIEPVIGVSSDLTLLELSDLNHPLLKQMALEAQGTYHHSQVTSQLAEQAARAIGANPLLTRVGTLFHDIGKLGKPDYYVENQRGGPNKHDELSPSMSALIVAAHVKEGMELGRRWRLPQAVIDFIPEHHGTCVMEYFYHKALQDEQNETVKVDDFRYPGPRPRSRETAILMLADGVEAAARSLVKPTPARIRDVIKQVVDKRLLNGELDDSPHTMSDLGKIRETFVSLLTAIHHRRISYPGQRERELRFEREGRADPEFAQGREGARPRDREGAPGDGRGAET